MGTGNRLRRHVPPLMFLNALTLMVIAITAPCAAEDIFPETIIVFSSCTGAYRGGMQLRQTCDG